MNLTQTAALPLDLYTAPVNRTCSTRTISVVALPKNAAPNINNEVRSACQIKALNAAKTITPAANAMTVAIGKPRRLANKEANVCSCHVTGNQYIGCDAALTPASCICWSIVNTILKIKTNVGMVTKKLTDAVDKGGKGTPGEKPTSAYMPETIMLAKNPPTKPMIAAAQ